MAGSQRETETENPALLPLVPLVASPLPSAYPSARAARLRDLQRHNGTVSVTIEIAEQQAEHFHAPFMPLHGTHHSGVAVG
jgi:hypothetical protein